MVGRAKFSGWLAVAGMFAAACGPSPEEQQQIAELPTVVSERDQLKGEVDRLTAELAAIESELANRSMVAAPADQEAVRPTASAAVGHLVSQVSEMEEQLTAASTRLRSVTATSATQRERITALETSIAEERTAMDGQRQRVASLEVAISGLEAEMTRQGAENRQLEQTVEQMSDEVNEVWYVVGTKEELLDRGIIREEGGSRVLFIFGKRGKTIVPSRTADPTLFTAADLRTLNSIPLPVGEADATWTVVTPQDLAAVGTPQDEKGRVLGDALSINDPHRFWANSRYLIVMKS